MKLSITINDFKAPQTSCLNDPGHIGNFNLNLEADFAPLAKILCDPSVAREYWNLRREVMTFFEQNPDIISANVEALIGGVVKGTLNTVDKHLSPWERLNNRIHGLMVRLGLRKPKEAPSTMDELKKAMAAYRDGLGDGRYSQANSAPDNTHYQQGYDEGQAQRAEAEHNKPVFASVNGEAK